MALSRPSLTKRKPSFSLKKQCSDSQNIEEIKESHPKDFRLLTYCFYNNINQYYSKRHKDVLGELEDGYKIPLAKEEKMFMEENLDSIIEKNIFKLTKDILMRNVCIAKNINHYSENYYKITNSSSTQATNLLDTESIETTDKDKRNSSNDRKRPSSSSKNQEKRSANTMSGSPQHKRSRNGTISMGKEEYRCSEVNNEEAESYVYKRENCRRVSKTKLNSKHIKCKDRIVLLEEMNPSGMEGDTYFMKNKSEVMGVFHEKEKPIEQLNLDKGENIKIFGGEEQSTFSFDLRSMKAKGSMNKFFNIEISNGSKQQSIDEMEKIKVQNRILSINSNFSTGMAKSQGYRPKSKCWGTPVNSIGKLNIKDRVHFRSTVREGSFRESNSNNERESRFLSTFLRYKP